MIHWHNWGLPWLLVVTGCSGASSSGGGSDSCPVKTDGELVARWAETVRVDNLGMGEGVPAAYAVINSVATDPQGNAFVAGTYLGPGKFAGMALPWTNEDDSFLAKLDGNGKVLWLKQFVGIGNEHVSALAVTADGGVLGFAYVEDSLDFGGGTVNVGSLSRTCSYCPAGGSVLFHYGPGGEYRFARPGSVGSLALAPNGDIVVAGSFAGVLGFGGGSIVSGGPLDTFDAFLARLDAKGNEIFVKVFGDDSPNPPSTEEANQLFTGVVVARDGTAYVSGDGATTINGTKLAGGTLVAAFDPSGHALFAKSFLTPEGSISLAAFAVAPGGGILLTGELFGTLDFGGGPIQGGSTSDVAQSFLLALSPKGDFAWSRSMRSERGGGISAMTTSSCFVQVAGYQRGQINVGDGVIGASELGDGFIALLSPEGKLLDGRRFTGIPSNMAQRADGSFVLSGFGGLAVGGMSIDTPMSYSAFAVDFAPLAQ